MTDCKIQEQLHLHKYLSAEQKDKKQRCEEDYLLWDFFLSQTEMSAETQANNNTAEDRMTKVLDPMDKEGVLHFKYQQMEKKNWL